MRVRGRDHRVRRAVPVAERTVEPSEHRVADAREDQPQLGDDDEHPLSGAVVVAKTNARARSGRWTPGAALGGLAVAEQATLGRLSGDLRTGRSRPGSQRTEPPISAFPGCRAVPRSERSPESSITEAPGRPDRGLTRTPAGGAGRAGSGRDRTECRASRLLDKATAAPDPPFAVVDLAAFDANADVVVARAGGTPIRVAQQVGAQPRPAAPGAGPAGLAPGSWPTPCPRRSGWPAARRTGQSTTSWSATRRRTGPPCGPGDRPGAGRAASR